MSYYTEGYVQTNEYGQIGTSSEFENFACYSVKQYDSSYKALCVLKYLYGSPAHYVYDIVCAKTPISIDSTKTIQENVNNYMNNYQYTRLYSKYVTNTNTYPNYENPTNSRSYQTLFSHQETIAGKRDIHFANIPIFTITNDNVSGVNNYINSGDDSDADNYSDLHPSLATLKVWLDGNYPTMYMKLVLDEGEGSNDVSVSIYANPNLSPTLTMHDSFGFDIMRSYSYGQYSHANPIINTRYEIVARYENEPVSAYFVLKSNGEVESTTSGIGNQINIEFYTGSPSDNEYPEDNTDITTNPTYNNYSGTNTLTKTYELDNVKLKTFGNFMWSSTFKDNVFSLLQSPIENIVSLKAMPLNGIGGDSENIKVGNVDSNIQAPVVVDADSKKTTVGTVKIPRIFNNFVDYTQFNVTIYLPFIGFKELDAIGVMGKTLKLYYIWDCVLGNVMAELYIQGDNGSMLLYQCWQGSCGIDIAISSTNRGQIESGYVNNGISAVASLFSGNLVGAAKDVFSGLTQEFHSESNGVGNPSLLGKMDMTARIIIKRPQSFKPKGYGHIVGFPCHQYNKLKTFGDGTNDSNKFVRCKNFACSIAKDDNDMDIVINALDSEKREMKELLESGVFV